MHIRVNFKSKLCSYLLGQKINSTSNGIFFLIRKKHIKIILIQIITVYLIMCHWEEVFYKLYYKKI